MTVNALVLDSSVFLKLILQEADTPHAQDFFFTLVSEKIKLFVPEHFFYEVASVCIRSKIPLHDAVIIYDTYLSFGLQVVNPSKEIWFAAEKMCQSGHPKSGFPALYDAIYHALAIEMGAVFVTADRRHISKTTDHGGICALSDWKSLFPAA